MLKPQDLLVALYAATHEGGQTFAQMAAHLHLGLSTAHTAYQSAKEARLLGPDGHPDKQRIADFTVYGAPVAYPGRVGGRIRGVRTAWTAAPIDGLFAIPSGQHYVWPDRKGDTRGLSLEPIHRAAVGISRSCGKIYAILALIDIIRVGGARERGVAAEQIYHQIGVGY